jgi:hypothetical protein
MIESGHHVALNPRGPEAAAEGAVHEAVRSVSMSVRGSMPEWMLRPVPLPCGQRRKRRRAPLRYALIGDRAAFRGRGRGSDEGRPGKISTACGASNKGAWGRSQQWPRSRNESGEPIGGLAGD